MTTLSGAQRAKRAGKRQLNIQLTPEEYDLLTRAAKSERSDGRRESMAQIVRVAGLRDAKKILASALDKDKPKGKPQRA